MKNKDLKFNLQLFAEENITAAADLEPAISVDFVTRLSSNITELQNLLGITELDPMNEGTIIKIYKMVQTNDPDQVGEGEDIKLTKVKQELARTIEVVLKKYRKQTTAEAIQKSGRSLAINKTDEKLLSNIQKKIKRDFYDVLGTGTGTAAGKNLQSALSAAWGAVTKFYDDEDATPIYFVSSDDVAEYLATAQVTMQTAFGMSYIEDFLGLGTVVISPSLTKGMLIATAKENLRGAYIPAGSGDLSDAFGLTSDTTGLLGMTHAVVTGTASIETLIFSGVVFYPELLDGVVVATIEDTGKIGTLTVTSAAGTNTGNTKVTVSPEKETGNIYKYKVADAVETVVYGQSVKNWSVWDGVSDITAATGKKITVVEANGSYRALKSGNTTVTAKS